MPIPFRISPRQSVLMCSSSSSELASHSITPEFGASERETAQEGQKRPLRAMPSAPAVKLVLPNDHDNLLPMPSHGLWPLFEREVHYLVQVNLDLLKLPLAHSANMASLARMSR